MKIPQQEWLIERNYLHPYYKQIAINENLLPYKVRKDNTVSYKSNFYTLPLNTYQGADTIVFLKAENETLYLYANDKSLLTTHKLSSERGLTIRNTDHKRDKSHSLEVLKSEVNEIFSNIPEYTLFIEKLSIDKQRYLRDNLQVLKSKTVGIERSFIEKALHICIENGSYNANTFVQTALFYQKESQVQKAITTPYIEIKSTSTSKSDYEPQRSHINTYQKIMQ
jgi:hypothetical protein